MAILSYTFPFIQTQGAAATRVVSVACSDSLSTILADGYMNTLINLGHPMFVNDIVQMTYNSATGPVVGYFSPVIASTGIVTLIPFEQANVLRFNTAFNHTLLASAGAVVVIPASTAQQYQCLDVKLAGIGGTNFSGGSGDRLLQLKDSSSVYTLIPAATLQALTNSVWGSTACPAPASVAFNALTVAGSAVQISYEGGSLDYTAGAAVLSSTWLRVA